MQKKIDVSVIIVNYKVQLEVFSCIESIYKSKPKISFEIIVIDNSEKDLISRKLKTKFPQVKYIKPSGNLGYGAGNNLGVKNAKGEFVLFLNPDTRFKNNVLDVLTKFVKKNKKVGAVSPLLLKENGQAYDLQGSLELTPLNAVFSISILNKIFPNNPISQKFWLKDWNHKSIQEVEVCPGTAFMISKDLFVKAGKFDERFFLYFEENDLCNRIKKLGYKIFINPKAILTHRLGISTAKNPKSDKFFLKSRFIYFKKHYGLLRAIPTELILRINKEIFLIFSIFVLGTILRIYKLSENMTFIGDQGWFYISARDIILTGNIPLVGITSSHTWLHQGALWTYALAVLFKIFYFNPLAPGYFIAILDSLTVVLIYKFAKTLFSEKTALMSAFFYATSPWIVLTSRMPYHTSMIPLLTAFLLFSIYKWVRGNTLFFPIIIFILAALYNQEIATFSLTGVLVLYLFYGILRKKNWALGVFRKRILLFSSVGFLIPMTPFLIYDTEHGFPQTIKVVVWIFYRIGVFLGYPPVNPNAPGETWLTWTNFIIDLIKKLIFYPDTKISLIILGLAFLFLGYLSFINSKSRKNLGYKLIFVSFLIPSLAYISAKTNSAAYLLIFFPQLSIMLGILFGNSFKNSFLKASLVFLTILIGISNTYYMLRNELNHNRFFQKIKASETIINQAGKRQYNLVGIGEGSQYESFTMGFEYLTWWLGHGPSKKDEKLKFYVSEYPDRIVVEAKKN